MKYRVDLEMIGNKYLFDMSELNICGNDQSCLIALSLGLETSFTLFRMLKNLILFNIFAKFTVIPHDLI